MVEKDVVRRGYGELADGYAARRSDDGRKLEILVRVLDSLSDPTRLLDTGCGPGTPVLSRMSASAPTIGIDLSREQLRLAADDAPESSLVQGDMTVLPFDAATFDAVVAYWSLIHVPMDDHETVIDEFARVLRPGGRLLLCEGTNEWLGENPDWLESGVTMERNIAGAETTRAQLRNAGSRIRTWWGVPEELEDGDDAAEDDDEDRPWRLFSAQLAA